MKKILLLCLLTTVFCKVSTGQVMVGDLNVNSLPDVKYIEMSASRSSGNLVIAIDYGQESRKNDDAFFMTGPDKKKIEFKSNMDALNYLARNGWELVNSYVLFGSGRYANYYLLKKKE